MRVLPGLLNLFMTFLSLAIQTSGAESLTVLSSVKPHDVDEGFSGGEMLPLLNSALLQG